MPVVSVERQWRGWSFRADARRQQSIPAQWLITVDSRMDGPAQIIADAQNDSWGAEKLVKQYQPYSFGNDASESLYCKELALDRVDNSDLVWLATAFFDNTVDPGQSGDSPFDRAPIDEWDFAQFERTFDKDIDDVAIVNSAGQAYDPGLTGDDSRPILTYTRNEPYWPSQILDYQDAINSDTFLGVFPAFTAKVNIRAGKRWENGVKYYETRYTFQFRRDGWREEILNRGTQYLKTAGAKPVSIPPGEPPVNLDEDGTRVNIGGEPTYKTHKIYQELPFAPLNIIIY